MPHINDCQTRRSMSPIYAVSTLNHIAFPLDDGEAICHINDVVTALNLF